MGLELEILSRVHPHQRLQLLENRVGLSHAALGELVLVVHDLRAHNPMDGGLIDADLAEPICQLVPVFAAEKVGG